MKSQAMKYCKDKADFSFKQSVLSTQCAEYRQQQTYSRATARLQ